MAERVHADTEEGKEEARTILNEIWDMPAEYEALGLLEGLTEEEQETTREELKRLSWEIHGR
jgi:DNA-binding MarR family transcriptional regulator